MIGQPCPANPQDRMDPFHGGGICNSEPPVTVAAIHVSWFAPRYSEKCGVAAASRVPSRWLQLLQCLYVCEIAVIYAILIFYIIPLVSVIQVSLGVLCTVLQFQ